VGTEKAIRFDLETNLDNVGGDDRADPPGSGSSGRSIPVPDHRLRQRTRRSGSSSLYCGASSAAALDSRVETVCSLFGSIGCSRRSPEPC
jgi:hypothetical protein